MCRIRREVVKLSIGKKRTTLEFEGMGGLSSMRLHQKNLSVSVTASEVRQWQS